MCFIVLFRWYRASQFLKILYNNHDKGFFRENSLKAHHRFHLIPINCDFRMIKAKEGRLSKILRRIDKLRPQIVDVTNFSRSRQQFRPRSVCIYWSGLASLDFGAFSNIVSSFWPHKNLWKDYQPNSYWILGCTYPSVTYIKLYFCDHLAFEMIQI